MRGEPISSTLRSRGNLLKKRRSTRQSRTERNEGVDEKVKLTRRREKRKGPPTEFQERLYAVCKKIPKGKVATYGLLAGVIGSSARAVGQALRNNPYAPVVPCHRVVASTLEIGGFGGEWGEACEKVQRKREILMEEGVAFQGFKVRGQEFIVDPSLLGDEGDGVDE
ncbi:hypothetical protein BSKO_08512 [Bryopsis sp. KO-2023]|nr:hypothetical protein BSKO_08512 [Bryopsis sp. KO-2023]